MTYHKQGISPKTTGMARRLAVLLAIFLIIQLLPLTSFAAAPYTGSPLKPIQTITQNTEYNENTKVWDIATQGGEKVRVVFYKDDLFRIWMANNGTGDFVEDMPNITTSQKWDIGGDEFEEFNIVIKSDFGAAPTVSFAETESYYEFSSSTLTLRAYKNPFTFELRKTANGEILWKEKEPLYYNNSRNTQVLETDTSEYFYGGGMQVGHVNHKGRTMVVQRDGTWVVDGVPNPSAFYMTTKGYGVFRNTIANGRYDFTSNEVVDTYHLDNRFDAYYFYGPSFDHILDDFTDLTGRPRMLPRWAIGLGDASAYRQLNDTRDQGGNPSNMQNVGSEASGNYQPQQTPFGGFWREKGTVGVVDDYIEQYLNKDTPVSWFLPNDGYRCEYNKYTHPAGGLDVLGRELRKYGIRFGLWIGQPSNYTAANYTYGYPTNVSGNDRAPYFTNEIVAQAKSGARVYKVDVAWSSGKSGNKGPMSVYRYLLINIETNSKTEENPDGERGFIVGVYGWTGVQRYATVWSGDQMGTYDYTSYHVPTFAGAGMSGFPFSFNDAGSIYNDYPGVYVRDLQMKTLMPLNYAMSNWGNRVSYAEIEAAWDAAGNRQDAGPNNTDEFPPNSEQRITSDKRPSSEYHFTDGELDINHKYLMLKQQMVPYIYSYIRHSSLTGAPLVRPMVYNFQDDPYTYGEETKYQYMSGDWLLAAPVINAIDTVRDNIYLPAGRWVDYWTGESYFGPTTITVNAPYDIMPMFARAGAIVPMSQEFLYDGQEYYTNKAGKTIEVKDTLLLDLYPEGTTSFDLYEDDGYTLKYETKEEYTYTTITTDAPAEGTGPLTVTVGAAAGNAFEGQVAARKNLLMIHTQTLPGVVKLGGADGTVLPLYNSKTALEDLDNDLGGWFFDPDDRGGILYVRTPSLPTDSSTVVWVDNYTVPAPAERTEGVLPIPQNVAALALRDTTIEVTWDKVSSATVYAIEIDNGTTTRVIETSTNTYRHEKLSPESTLTYRVRALNASGTGIWSDPVRATTLPARTVVPKGAVSGVKAAMSAVFTQSDPLGNTYSLSAGTGNAGMAVDTSTVTIANSSRFVSAVVTGDIVGGWKPNLDINMGGEFLINSFDYMPNQQRITGTVMNFRLYTSLDGVTWTPVTILDEYGNPTGSAEGYGSFRDQLEPIWTTSFMPVVARYVRMQQQTSTSNRFTTTLSGRYVWIYSAGDYNADGDPVTGVTLSQTAAALDIGDTLPLTASAVPADALNANLIFSSSNEMVAKVSQTGLVTAMGGGTAVITAASQADPSIAAACTVTVTGIPAASLSIDGADALYAAVGEAFQLTAARAPIDATGKVIWSSSDGESVLVSHDGFVTILQYKETPVTITVAIGDVTDSITIQPVKIASLAVDNAAGTITATFTHLPSGLREDGFRAACDIGLGQQSLTIAKTDVQGNAVTFAFAPLTQAIDKTTADITLWYIDGIAVNAAVAGLAPVCAVIFDGNGADADAIPGLITVPAGQTIALPLPPAKNGYTFAGWYTAKGSTGTQFDPALPVTQSVILYAHWSEKAYTVKFDWGTGEYTNLSFAYDSLIAPPDPIDRDGYRLTGWFKNVELTIPWDFETELLKGGTTLYARWTPEYTVSFASNGGSAVADIGHLLQGSQILAPAAPAKDGYLFTGWYKDAALTAPWNFTSDTVTANITLYANWSVAGTATVAFNTTGGEEMASVTRAVGGVIGPIDDPIRVGDIFQGWYADEGLTIPWDLENYLIPGDMTLYAKWTNLGDMVFYYPFDDEQELAITEEPYAAIARNGVTLDKTDGFGADKGALRFEDGTSYLRVDGNSFSYGTGKTFTVSMWINPDNVNRLQNLFAASPSGTTANDWLVLRTLPIPGTTELGGYLGQSNLGDSTTADGSFNVFGGIQVEPIKAGEWTQVTVVVEIDRIKYYINGRQIGQTNSARWYGSTVAYFSLGGRSGDTNTTGCFTGLMDEVRFYDFALSAQQVSLLHEYYQDSEDAPVITSVDVTTPTIVETLAANLRINVEGQNLDGRSLTAYVSVNGVIDESTATDITSGTALMKIAAAPAADADCEVVVKVDGTDVQGSFAMTLAAYKPDELWTPDVAMTDGRLTITFSEDTELKTTLNCVTIDGQNYSASVLTGKRVVEVQGFNGSLADGTTIVIKGVKYPRLFPSYSFTFTLQA